MSGLNESHRVNTSYHDNTWSPCGNATGNQTGSGLGSANGTDLCGLNVTALHTSSHQQNGIKTYFHMRDDYRSPSDLFVGNYDPRNGIRTACFLGGFLLFVMVYVIYKAKCKKNRWTSTDRIFIERYKQKLADRELYAKAKRRKSFREMHGHAKQEEAALEATAKWIQNQPLDIIRATKKKKVPTDVCNVCLKALETPSCPTCSKSQSRISMETGFPTVASWSLTGKHQGKNRLGIISSTLNSTKDLAVIPIYTCTTPNNNQNNAKNDFESKFLKGDLDTNFVNKHSNMEYLNLHVDSPEADVDKKDDKNITKVDMCKLFGSRSCEVVSGEDKIASMNLQESSPLLQMHNLNSGDPPILSHDINTVDIPNSIMVEGEGKPRDIFGARKSDSYLHPPFHDGEPAFSPYGMVVPSPHLLSPHNSLHFSPDSTTPRPNRSTLSLHLPRTFTPDSPYKT